MQKGGSMVSLKETSVWSIIGALSPVLVLLCSFGGSYAMIKADGAVASKSITELERRVKGNEAGIECAQRAIQQVKDYQVTVHRDISVEMSKLRESQVNTNKVVGDLTKVLHNFEQSINNINIVLGRIDERWKMMEDKH